jgi:WD40 repeat protein
MLDFDLNQRGTIEQGVPITAMRETYPDQVVLARERDSALELRDLASWRIVRSLDLGEERPICLDNWCGTPITVAGTARNSVYVVDMRVELPVCTWTFKYPRMVVPLGNGLVHAAASDEAIWFFDPRMNDVCFKVSGNPHLVLNYHDKLLSLSDSGTFFLDPETRSGVRGLFDTRESYRLRTGDDGSCPFPTLYQKSLHSHIFQVTSACVDPAGMCISGDCAGWIHLWSPKKLEGWQVPQDPIERDLHSGWAGLLSAAERPGS